MGSTTEVPPTAPGTSPVHRPAGSGDALWAMGSLFELKLTAAESEGALGIAEVTQPPGIATPLHSHVNEAEVFFLLEGTILYEAGGILHELGPGSLMYLPREVPHRFRITGNRPARILVIAIPGSLLDLYAEVGVPAAQRSLPAHPDPDEIGRWNQVAPDYGLRVLGPPLSSG